MGYYGKHQSQIGCPFYIRESETSVTCEGIEEGLLTHKFESESVKYTFQREYCVFDCERCSHGKMLYRKYDEKFTGK